MLRTAIWLGAAIMAGMLFAGGAWAAPLPGCAPAVEVAAAKVIRVEKNGVLVLADGRAVAVEGILLPKGARDHAPAFLAQQAVALLGALTRDRRVTLAAAPPKEDRYDRIRAQVFFREDDAEPWLQIALLRRGLARVSIAPDRRECASELYAAEREARTQRTGIWALPAYAVRTPDTVGNDIGTFQIVEGVVKSAETRDGRTYLNFGDDWRSDFTATIAPDAMALFRQTGIDPRSYAGTAVQVRGWIQSLNGPEIEIADPESIVVVSP